MEHIEALQSFLVDQGMSNFKILTPKRNYAVRRSQYGDKKILNTTSVPGNPSKMYSISVDDSQRQRASEATAQAKTVLDEHNQQQGALDERREQATAEKQQRHQELAAFNASFEDINVLEKKQPAIQQRLDEARKAEAAFDITAQRAALQTKLVAAARNEAKSLSKIVKLQQTTTQCNTEWLGARLAFKSATHQMASASAERDALCEKVNEAKQAHSRLKEETKSKFADATNKRAEAKNAAPQFEKDARGQRSAEAEASWNSMANDLDELEAEIASLEEEVENADDDDGRTLKEYEQRCKDIEKVKETVGDTQRQVLDMRGRLAELTEEWKPALEKMVAEVDQNFSAYFERFSCVGKVELCDGRKLNPQTGEPEGPDDFSAYKIHIKVQWRQKEALHVLGEGGRDSGGERSVATMIYLISLQTVNPAPFRVVDEINQAMDSHNERHVFECITHACRSGGKQYFLLTPKLLPDLDYGEETAIQLVINGPHAQSKSQLSLASFV